MAETCSLQKLVRSLRLYPEACLYVLLVLGAEIAFLNSYSFRVSDEFFKLSMRLVYLDNLFIVFGEESEGLDRSRLFFTLLLLHFIAVSLRLTGYRKVGNLFLLVASFLLLVPSLLQVVIVVFGTLLIAFFEVIAHQDSFSELKMLLTFLVYAFSGFLIFVYILILSAVLARSRGRGELSL